MPFYNKELIAPDTHSTIRIGEEVTSNFYTAADELAQKLFGKDKLSDAMDSLYFTDKDGNIEKFDPAKYKDSGYAVYEFAVTNTLFVRDKDNILRQFSAKRDSDNDFEINISTPIKPAQVKEPVKPSFITYLLSRFIESFRARVDDYNQMKKVVNNLKTMADNNRYNFNLDPQSDPLANEKSYSKKQVARDAAKKSKDQARKDAKDLSNGPVNLRNLKNRADVEKTLNAVKIKGEKNEARFMLQGKAMMNVQDPEVFYEKVAQFLEGQLAGEQLNEMNKVGAEKNTDSLDKIKNTFTISSAAARDYVKTVFDEKTVNEAFQQRDRNAAVKLGQTLDGLRRDGHIKLMKFAVERTKGMIKSAEPPAPTKTTPSATQNVTQKVTQKDKGKTMGSK